jgi:hypothetical protein
VLMGTVIEGESSGSAYDGDHSERPENRLIHC